MFWVESKWISDKGYFYWEDRVGQSYWVNRVIFFKIYFQSTSFDFLPNQSTNNFKKKLDPNPNATQGLISNGYRLDYKATIEYSNSEI